MGSDADRLNVAYARAEARISRLLFEDDPIGLNFGDNADEYDSEASDILRRLGDAASEKQLTRIVHEVFVGWFDEQTAGPVRQYDAVAKQIWALRDWRSWGREDS